MKDIQKLINDADRADAVAALMQDVNPHAVLALADRLKSAEAKYKEVSGWYSKMKTRMLAAEAQLAELADLVPVAYIIQDAEERGRGRPGFLSYDRSISDEDINEYEISVTPLYTRPAPPAPVKFPDEKSTDIEYAYYPLTKARHEGWNACRAEVLRLNAIDNTAQQYEALAKEDKC